MLQSNFGKVQKKNNKTQQTVYHIHILFPMSLLLALIFCVTINLKWVAISACVPPKKYKTKVAQHCDDINKQTRICFTYITHHISFTHTHTQSYDLPGFVVVKSEEEAASRERQKKRNERGLEGRREREDDWREWRRMRGIIKLKEETHCKSISWAE